MDANSPITRRAVLKDMGKAGLAVMVFGTACTAEPTSEPTGTGTSPASSTTSGSETTTTAGDTTTTPSASTAGTMWARAEMAIVSAYILYRGGEAALIDTGQSGSAPDIEAALGGVGLGWEAVGHVILTHRHPDHVGSVDAVAELATNSVFHIGEGDAEAVGDLGSGGTQLASDGDNIFDLRVIETSGHTVGHISVLDEAAGILVVGDAMNRMDGVLSGSNPSFTADAAAADESVRKLAGFEFEVVLFGHSDPILSGGSAEVRDLATALGS
ncbi:MAG TPA: MBL fold metallo-hydrolase [Acidimicrobiia bacterium]|nr:MBL fold metallo-hydrolase [Acidimicrobiia bacterium]